jgi:hypothetical protein
VLARLPFARLLLPVLVVGLLLAAPGEARARPDGAAEARLVDSVNAERSQRGIPRLVVSPELRDIARGHSRRMADVARLHHNGALRSEVGGARRAAENVGRGGSVGAVHAALMGSAGHRGHILDPTFVEVGIGVEVRGGSVWVTQVFRTPHTAPTIGFRDVRTGSAHAAEIVRLAQAGVTLGCGSDTYCPARTVRRGEMASFLARAGGLLPRDPVTFGDTAAAGAVHAANIEALHAAGVTTGCGPGRYCPERAISRAEMASFLARALDLPRSSTTTRFGDVPPGSTHAGSIEAIARAGITSGCGTPGRYCPDRPVTRAEMASFLVRAFAP